MPTKQSLILKCLSIANLCFMLTLAIWQIQRAHTKYTLTQIKPTHFTHEAQLKNHLQVTDKTSIDYHHPIGTKKYFIIEPAIFHHQVGKEIIAVSFSPILEKSILINLGWFDSNTNTDTVIEKQQLNTTITGILYTPRGRLLQKNIHQDNWPKKIGFIDLNAIENHLKTPVYEKIIITSNSALYENLTQPNTLPLGILRHICYALQFLLFGILGLYFKHKLSRKQHAKSP